MAKKVATASELRSASKYGGYWDNNRCVTAEEALAHPASGYTNSLESGYSGKRLVPASAVIAVQNMHTGTLNYNLSSMIDQMEVTISIDNYSPFSINSGQSGSESGIPIAISGQGSTGINISCRLDGLPTNSVNVYIQNASGVEFQVGGVWQSSYSYQFSTVNDDKSLNMRATSNNWSFELVFAQ